MGTAVKRAYADAWIAAGKAHAPDLRDIQLLHRAPRTLSRPPRLAQAGAGYQKRQLVPAKARQQLAAAPLGAQLGGNQLQHRIPRPMAMEVVDLLERVDVEQRKRERAVAAHRQRDIVAQAHIEGAAVVQASADPSLPAQPARRVRPTAGGRIYLSVCRSRFSRSSRARQTSTACSSPIRLLMLEGAPMVLLTNTGAKTGQTPPLVCQASDEDGVIFIIASKAGAPDHPAWSHDLKAHPDVVVERGTERFEATATELTGEHRDEIFARQRLPLRSSPSTRPRPNVSSR